MATFEVRLTVHKRGMTSPDYNEVHRRMEDRGFARIITIAGQPFSLLGGMYRGESSDGINDVRQVVREVFGGYTFEVSFEVIKVAAETTDNLKPTVFSLKKALEATGAIRLSPSQVYGEPQSLASMLASSVKKESK